MQTTVATLGILICSTVAVVTGCSPAPDERASGVPQPRAAMLTQAEPVPYEVPADPKASYRMLVNEIEDGRRFVVTERTSPMWGTSYSNAGGHLRTQIRALVSSR